MIKAIIFDYDDTLVKTKEIKWKALIETGKRYFNLEIDDEHIAKFWGLPFEKMLTGVLKNADTYEKLQEAYFKTTDEFPMEEHQDALDVMTHLLNIYKVGVLTASNKKLVEDDLTRLHFPIKDFFYIQTSEDTDIHKPNPKVFQPILDKLSEIKISKSETVYIGDAVKDYEAARDAGIKFIGINHNSMNVFKDTNSKVVSSFKELLDYIKGY